MILMKPVSLLLIFVILCSCSQKSEPVETSYLKPASEFFPKEKTRVMVVGTFHFDYPGLDVNKTAEEDKIDVLVEPKKSEVTDVVEYIKEFKPTKIAIEAFDSWKATDKLRGYNEGKYRDERDERFQLAIRLASELKLDTLYSINATSYDEDLIKLDSVYFEKLFRDFDFQNDDPYNAYYQAWFKENSGNIPKVNLLEYLKHINSKESHQYGFGAYLVGDFKLDNVRGADILSIWWYNRNLRIFRKLQQITENTDDRILVIFGNGHAEILRQLLESSPEFEFIEFDTINS
jgi:hypothetical protein